MAIRKTYSKAFKIEAVRLLGLGEKPAAQLALQPRDLALLRGRPPARTLERILALTVDSAGYALADGGFNATLRDYARFGLMHQNGGVGNGRRILPVEWVEDTWRGDHSIFGAPYTGALPNGAYRNQFWIPEHGKRAYTARGVFGQFVHVDPDSELVAVKLSSWPEFQSIPRTRTFMNAVGAIAARLGK